MVVAKRCCKRESPRLGGPSLMPLRHQLLLLEQWSSLKPRTAKRPLNLTYLLRESRSQRKGRGPFPTTAAKIKKATLPPPFKRYLHKIPFYRTLLLPSFFLKKGDGKFFFFFWAKKFCTLISEHFITSPFSTKSTGFLLNLWPLSFLFKRTIIHWKDKSIKLTFPEKVL